ncbi:MAG: N-acyl homoserine lactonase family protein [Desulfobacteraceae bacterium]|nr:MAG: N-acyl homoserine lactonase family protein [Desulfobacteraceae bacterium]
MELTIHPLVPTRIAIEAGRITYLRNYGKRLTLPCPFFVIKGGKFPVLVDTSGSAEIMAGLRTEPVEHVMGFKEALLQVGLTPQEIKLVIHTHLMYDHCANSRHLPNARFVVQKKELEFALDPHPMFAGVYQKHLFENLPFDSVDGDAKLMPGIELLFTPGHSPGIQSVAVETRAGLAIITGFCCISENFAAPGKQVWATDVVPEVIPPGFHTDMRQAYESALRVKNMADLIIPFHDPEMAAKRQIPD